MSQGYSSACPSGGAKSPHEWASAVDQVLDADAGGARYRMAHVVRFRHLNETLQEIHTLNGLIATLIWIRQ